MNLYFIGFRGAGKSTIGRAVAKAIGRPFRDTDEIIANNEKLSITEIFERFGENHFRSLESRVVAEFAVQSNLVVAFGGGVTIDESNRRLLKKSGRSVWLRAPAKFLFERIQKDPKSPGQRPRLSELNGLNEVEHLLSLRESHYADCADYTVDVENRSVDEIVDQIVHWWHSVDN